MLMSRTDIMDSLRELLTAADERRRGDAERATEETRLVEDLAFTSIDMLYMVIAAEEQFGVRFTGVTMGSFHTLGDVVDYLQGAMKP